MSVIIRDLDIPVYGCSECPFSHKVFNGSETVLACYAKQRETSDDGTRPEWCSMQTFVTCKECKYAVLTTKGEVKYCKCWQADEDGSYGGDPLYLDGDFYCGCGERKLVF